MIAPTHFQELYRCVIQPTGERIYKLPDYRPQGIPLSEGEKWLYENEREIAIKMPESDYVRFMENYNMFMTILRASKNFPHVKDQFETVAVMANMLK
jgi:hypothetical protein